MKRIPVEDICACHTFDIGVCPLHAFPEQLICMIARQRDCPGGLWPPEGAGWRSEGHQPAPGLHPASSFSLPPGQGGALSRPSCRGRGSQALGPRIICPGLMNKGSTQWGAGWGSPGPGRERISVPRAPAASCAPAAGPGRRAMWL